MQAIIFALISYFGWGIGDIFGTIAARKIGAYSSTLWYLIFQFVLSLPLAFLFVDKLQSLTLALFAFNFFIGIIGTAGLVTFYEGLKIGPVSLVGTISGSFVIVVVILSILFLGESLTNQQIAAMLIIFLGLFISTLNFRELKNRRVLAGKGIVLAVITMFLWGIYWAFIKIPVEALGWYWPAMISLSSFVPLFLYLRFRKEKINSFKQSKTIIPVLLNAILLGTGSFSFNFAIGYGLTSIVAPIAGSYPTLFAILAFYFFKDKLTKREILGIIITLAGIVFLSAVST